MSRSLRSFLLAYCQELTGCGTTSLKRLFKAVREGAPRACEAVFLFAGADGREGYLLRLARGTDYEAAYERAAADLRASGGDVARWLGGLPEASRYRKVWNAWRSESTRLQRDREMMPGIQRAIAQELDRHGLSRAQACRVLGLNKGNFYAFMSGDMTKMSRDTAMRAYRQLAETQD